jgi:hypothetical protein
MELSDIKSGRKRREVLEVLNDTQPTHNQRLWLAGFLGYITDKNEQEVFDFIHRLNSWSDYNEKITRQQIKSVFKISN